MGEFTNLFGSHDKFKSFIEEVSKVGAVVSNGELES